MVPSTTKVIEGLGKRNSKHVLVVPVAFTSDHIETLVSAFTIHMLWVCCRCCPTVRQWVVRKRLDA